MWTHIKKFHPAHVAYWLLSPNSHCYHKTSKLVYSPFLWSLLSFFLCIASREANNKVKRPENDQNHSSFSLTELIFRSYFYIPNNSNKFCNLPTKRKFTQPKRKRGKNRKLYRNLWVDKKNYRNLWRKEKKKREEAQGCNYGGLDPIVSVHHHLFMMP